MVAPLTSFPHMPHGVPIVVVLATVLIAVPSYTYATLLPPCPAPFILVSFLSTSTSRARSKLSAAPTWKASSMMQRPQHWHCGHPPPKQIFRPSPLKGVPCACDCVHDFPFWFFSHVSLNWWFRMDVQPTSSAPLPTHMCNVLPTHARL